MAEYAENQIKFGWLTKDEMDQAIADGKLNEYDICYLKDTHQQMLIDSELNPIPIMSRTRIYATVESAVEDINDTAQTYEGEILAIRDGEKFIAYIVNKFDTGEYYVSPIYSDSQIDYNDLQNIPIKNVSGTASNPVILKDLDDGCYKVTGKFVVPDGTEINSIIGNVIVKSTDIGVVTIKRIANNTIYDYTIAEDGTVTSDKYATEKFIEDKGYATEDYVSQQLAAFKITMEEYIQEYVATTCTLLIKHMIDDELNNRYSTEQDIKDLFDN